MMNPNITHSCEGSWLQSNLSDSTLLFIGILDQCGFLTVPLFMFYLHSQTGTASGLTLSTVISTSFTLDTAYKICCMVMSREQTAGLSHTMKVDNSSIERVKSSNIWERR